MASTIHSVPSRRRAALTHLVMNYLSVVVMIIQGVVLVPIYLSHIEPRMYGLWLATGGALAWLGTIDMGVSTLIGQKIAAAYGRKESSSIGHYYANGLLVQAGLLSILVPAGFVLSQKLPVLLGATSAEAAVLRPCVLLTCLSIAVTQLAIAQKSAADALQRPLVPMIGTVGGAIVAILLTVVLLRANFGLLSIPLSMVSGAGVTLLINALYALQVVKMVGGELYLAKAILVEMMRFAPPLFGGRLALTIMGRVEPTLATFYVGPEAAVAYTLTKRSAEVGQTILDRVAGAVTSGFAHVWGEADGDKAKYILNVTFAICLWGSAICLSVCLACNRSFIELWVGSKYFAGHWVSIICIYGAFPLIFKNLAAVLLAAAGDIAAPSWMHITESVCRMAAMTTLLPIVGLIGLPVAVVITCSGATLLLLLRLRSLAGMGRLSMMNRRIAIAGVIVCGSTAFGFAPSAAGWWELAVRALLIASTSAGIAYLSDHELRSELWALISSKERIVYR